MDDSFGPDFYTVEDEDGNTFELELADTLEHNGIVYHAFFTAEYENEEEDVEIDLDEEAGGIVLMKVVVEDDEEILSTLDSEEEENEIYELFMERFFEAEDEE